MRLCRHFARTEGIERALEQDSLNLVAFPLDSPVARVAAAGGYPIATVPAGLLTRYDGRPIGVAVIAGLGCEDVLFRFMGACEAGLARRGGRGVPMRLLDAERGL